SMAGWKKTLADLMSLIKGDDEGEDDSSATPTTCQEQGETGEASGQVDGADQVQSEKAVPLENTAGSQG
ncbi:hypothetical protein S245_051795, partial [Arachis hypogaea]